MLRGPAAVLLTFVLAGTAGVATTATEAGAGPRPAREAAQVDITPPTIEWGACDFYDAPAECASVQLPLDYDDPAGPTTAIGLLRMPARGEKIGTLFVNPGGPGGTATDFAAFAGRLIGPGVQRRFDVVGIDPRGIGTSGTSWCRVNDDALGAIYYGYPVTERETQLRLRADRAINEGCAEHRSAIVDHASTADVARDMDVVRQSLGEEQLSYYGISYGSLLGQTYAAMFPDRVRALIIDGVLNPVEWTSGNDPTLPMTYRLRSGRGAYEALTSALVECDRVGRSRCRIAGHANETWLRVVRKARAGELRIGNARIALQEVVSNALGSLYSAYSIRFLTDFLAEIDPGRGASRTESDSAARAWARLQRIRTAREEIGPYGWGDAARQVPRRDAQRPSRAYVQFESVICGDAVNPSAPRTWPDTSALADHRQPWFGRSWTWASSVCAEWAGRSGDDAFRGPWATTTSYPLLVVGNAHDPATPISGARAANRLFADSVLLLMNGWGHGALGDSDCVSSYLAAYLIDRTLPRPGTVCRPNHGPFAG